MSEKVNLFVSHYGGDEQYIESFKNLISKKYDIRDSSIIESEPNNATNKEYIKSILRSRIDWAGKVVVLVGLKTHEREWVNWEINYAAMNGDKRVVGVFLPGATDADLPEALTDYADACVPWSFPKIISALEGNDLWEDASGEPRPYLGNRGTC
ncbi:MTH538 TIR-like domain [Amphibacillus marinus]|uniref:MTH538 TIR-like domain n=1 Tax=Amphibacillus marinus TaxID=872970 RepID=A0A1H8SMP6_9BACI|nr:TIR domain-containing protein [Amphibacillus marinus]SEO79786.1 MTH538 TIR-like domain [Amphibacillus marinus]